MINDPLVKKLLATIVENEYEQSLTREFRERHPSENVPEGIYNIINALQLPKQDINKIIKDIKETVEDTIIPIIQALIDGIDTDEEIAEKTKIKLNIVRKMLYKLYDLGIADYKRSKDPETQWFTYTWIFEEEELVKLIKESSQKEIEKLKKDLDYEENNMFFVCPEGHARLDFDTASEHEFWCSCGEDLIYQDNEKNIERIKERIKESEENIESFIKKVEK